MLPAIKQPRSSLLKEKDAMMVTSAMKEKFAERSGARKTVFGVRPNEAYYEAKREIGAKTVDLFAFTGAEEYTGEWSVNMKEGFGTQTWTKGHKYEGEWMANKRHGKGTFWVREGSSTKLRKQYTGDWAEDKRHGVGLFIYKNGDRYEGEWCFNEREGMGKMFYADGNEASFYKGSWSRGKRSGLGVLVLANGDRFEGHWVNDKKEGPGRYYYKNTNKVYEGEWLDGSPKCGEFQEAPPGSFGSLPDSTSPTRPETNSNPFSIPDLHVLNPKLITSEATATVRNINAANAESDGMFSAVDLEELKRCFSEYDSEDSGFIYCSELYDLVSSTGVGVPEEMVNEVMISLEADSLTQISFPEFLDVLAVLTTPS